jgi:Zn-dependent protease with chaperone function
MRSGDIDALGLIVLATLLAWPVPARLARAAWPARCPRAALVLWQAIGLAGGLAAIGALLAAGLAPLAPHLGGGIDAALRRGLGGLSAWRLVSLTLGAALALRLLAVLAFSFVAISRDRRRHRVVLDLLGRPAREHTLVATPPDTGTPPRLARASGEVVMLDHPVAVAYCVPGVRPRVVLSHAVLDLLDEQELAAVLAHEHAHANGHHDLVVQPFVAWQRTFPGFTPARAATRGVALLVEMLADDAAARRTAPRTVAAALTRLGAARATMPGTLGATAVPQGEIVARVRRLLAPPAPVRARVTLAVYALALALVAVPTVLLLRP